MNEVKTLVLLNNEVMREHSTLNHSEHFHVPEMSTYKIIHVVTETLELNSNIQLSAHAHYEHWLINLSKTKVNYNMNIALQGEGAGTTIRAMILGQDKAQLKHQLRLDHNQNNTRTDILMHGIADHQSKVIFEGLIHVKEKIKGVDAKELLKNLLLTNSAEISVKPILEIYSNEVACAHGASIGDLEEDALFYLQSRGFSNQEAKAILLKSFATQFLPQLNNEALQTWIEQLILERLK